MSYADQRDDMPPSPTHGKACSVGELLSQLDDGERPHLQALLDNPVEWSQARLHKRILLEGHTVSEQMIGKHRRRSCSCWSTS